MAKQTAGFVDQHIEKVVLGVCAVIFVGTAAYYFGVGPYKIEEQDPKQLIEQARQVAEETQNRVRSAPPYDPSKEKTNKPDGSTEPLKVLARWFGNAAEGLTTIAGIDPKSPRTQAFPPPLLTVHGIADEDKISLARLVAPSTPIVISGHAYLDMPAQSDFEIAVKSSAGGRSESRERSWVSVAAQVNLAEQFKSFLAAKYPPGPLMTMPIIRVHLQRKVAGDRNADWEEVTPYTPYKRIALPEANFLSNGALDGTSSTTLSKFRDTIRASAAQDLIVRSPLPPKTQGTRGDEPFAPPLPYINAAPGEDQGLPGPMPNRGNDPTIAAGIQRAREWLGYASKALAGQRPFADPDPELAHLLARAASVTKGISSADIDRAKKLLQDAEAAAKAAKRTLPTQSSEEPEHLMPILAHDLDVTPGKTYVYRIRYEILNPLVGSANMRDPADARRMTLVSDWSPESRPVEVRSDLFYFLTKADAKTQTAEFTVFKKVAGGEFEKDTFKVAPGELVGGKKKNVDFSTQKVFVFIETTRGREPDTRVMLADAVDGNLSEHLLKRDASDKRMAELGGNGGRRRRG